MTLISGRFIAHEYDLPTTPQMKLAISISFCPQRRSAAIPHPFGLALRQ